MNAASCKVLVNIRLKARYSLKDNVAKDSTA